MAYEGTSGFLICLIDSYRLAVGDFEVAENFVDNSDFMWLFWLIFFIGTMMSLLIILNMVIAMMSETFTRVKSDTESYILRERLSLILEHQHTFLEELREKVVRSHYLVTVQVDPVVDPIEDDTTDSQLR